MYLVGVAVFCFTKVRLAVMVQMGEDLCGGGLRMIMQA